ncbi:MAG: hypothetical protein LBI18_08045, partial [Planctomycetaceae bacterium]|nr:hypothetical protein [Planctomycetaceae bacterium]
YVFVNFCNTKIYDETERSGRPFIEELSHTVTTIALILLFPFEHRAKLVVNDMMIHINLSLF